MNARVGRAGAALGIVALSWGSLPAHFSTGPALASEDPALASLPQVSSGRRPGPDLLYAPPPNNRQLQNHDPAFRAPFTLVSASERYVGGEYQVEDFLNDDHGPDADGGGDSDQGPAEGDLVYPTDVDRFANNAADIVEMRVSATDDGLALRFTLLTMRRVDDAIVAVVLDTDGDVATGSATLPRHPGGAFPGADLVVTSWGTGAEVSRLGPGAPVTTPVPSSVDLGAAQITIRVPSTVADPRGTVRYTAIAGLRDPASGGWRAPVRTATASSPGSGSDAAVAGIFDAAPSFGEPCFVREIPCDQNQALRLGAGNMMAAAHPLDLDALHRREDRDLVPRTGRLFRIFPSRLALGGGRSSTFPQFKADLQEYAAFVPSKVTTGQRVGITLYLHSNDRYHWGYSPSPFLQWLGEERGSIVVTPMGRHQGEFYRDESEADVWEVWNDVARNYRLDPDDAVSFGTSMGGYGTYRLVTLYPDLFAKAATNIGPPGAYIWVPPYPPELGYVGLTNIWLDNVRHVPFFNMVASADELVPYPGPRAQNLGSPENGIRGFEQLGYRFRFRTYSPAEHIALSLAYEREVQRFLAGARVVRDPAHVTFRYVPIADRPKLGLVRDHAYWISDVRLRPDASTAPVGPQAAAIAPPPKTGLVDAVSLARGEGDPPSSTSVDQGTLLTDTFLGVPLAWQEVGRSWGPAPKTTPRNALALRLEGIDRTSIDVARSGLRSDASIEITTDSDGPSVLTLVGAGRSATVHVPPGRSTAIVEPDAFGGDAVRAQSGLNRPAAGASLRTMPATGPGSDLTQAAVGGVALASVALALRAVRRRLS